MPHRSRRLAELRATGIPIYAHLQDLFAHTGNVDLLMICTPIHLHCPQTCVALARDVNVLCEKPLAGSLGDAMTMVDAQRTSKAFAAIGYQWSFSAAVQALKRDVMSGALGRPVRMRSMVSFPRALSYFKRNDWAGRLKTPGGEDVLDSPVNNAAAHYLHNMLYILGGRIDRSAAPVTVIAELYRAQSIESYDTAALRCMTDGGVEIIFIASHATKQARGPVFSYEFENATVSFADGEARGEIVARFNDGTTKRYGPPSKATDAGKLWATLDAIRSNTPVSCGIEAAIPHMQVTCAARQSMAEIVAFPASLICVEGDVGSRKTSVLGIDDALTRCYESGRLPSELGISWGVAARETKVQPFPMTPSQQPLTGAAS
jgi:predicted dehydrogenase